MVYEKLRNVLRVVGTAPRPQLRDPEFLRHLVAYGGLVHDDRLGDDLVFSNQGNDGFYQVPLQLAGFLSWACDKNIETFVEIGTWTGWTSALVGAYLDRFRRLAWAQTFDPRPRVTDDWYGMGREKLHPVASMTGTARDFAGYWPDLVFIDGDHTYEGVKDDWEVIGRRARFCAFHDANDSACPGVVRLWEGVKKDPGRSHVEFFHHSHNQPVMGIGVTWKNS